MTGLEQALMAAIAAPLMGMLYRLLKRRARRAMRRGLRIIITCLGALDIGAWILLALILYAVVKGGFING